MGIFESLRKKIHPERGPEAEKNAISPLKAMPLPPPPPPPAPLPAEELPAEKPAATEENTQNMQKETPPQKNVPETTGEKLPPKKRTPKGTEDLLTKKEKSMIFEDNLDLIALFRKGEFSEEETMQRQRSAIEARLRGKKIEPGKLKGILDDYGFYFRKELEEAKRTVEERKKAAAGKAAPESRPEYDQTNEPQKN